MSNKSQLQENNSLLNTILGIVSNKQVKEVTAGTEAKTVERSEGGILWSVKVHPTPSQSKTVTPSEEKQTVLPPAGMLLSSVDVAAIPSEYMNLELLECTKYAIDTFTFTSRTSLSNATVSHTLGAIPKIAIAISVDFASTTNSDIERIGLFKFLSSYMGSGEVVYPVSGSLSSGSVVVSKVTDSSIAFSGTSQYFAAGQVYRLITIA